MLERTLLLIGGDTTDAADDADARFFFTSNSDIGKNLLAGM